MRPRVDRDLSCGERKNRERTRLGKGDRGSVGRNDAPSNTSLDRRSAWRLVRPERSRRRALDCGVPRLRR